MVREWKEEKKVDKGMKRGKEGEGIDEKKVDAWMKRGRKENE